MSRGKQTSAPDTEAFRRWFGDSKVIDQNGEPLVVYHGAPDVRGIFADGFKRSPARGDVFFATDDPRTAETYTDPHRAWDYQNAEPGVIPLYLRIENPLVIDGGFQHWRNTEHVIEKARKAGHDGVIIENTIDHYASDRKAKPRREDACTVFAFFSPTQAKSALTEPMKARDPNRWHVSTAQPLDFTGPNDGTFDLDDPDLRSNPDKSTDPTVIEYAVRFMHKGKTPRQAAVATKKKLHGAENLMLGGGVVEIDEDVLELALYARILELAQYGLSRGWTPEDAVRSALQSSFYQGFDAKTLALVEKVTPEVLARMPRSNPSERVFLDEDLHDEVVAEAKARFDVWPSAYASGWVTRTYKARGGRFGGQARGQRSGLTKWFGEQWVDISKPVYDEDGELVGYAQCGREKGGEPADYPKCRPLKEAMQMTPEEVEDAVRRKRRAEKTAPKGRGRPPVRVRTYR